MHDRVKSKVLSTTQFGETSDLSTPYFSRIDMTRLDKIKAEEKFPISEQGYTAGKPLDGMECQILLDMGASKFLLSKSHYLRGKSFVFITKIFTQNAGNTSREWTIH